MQSKMIKIIPSAPFKNYSEIENLSLKMGGKMDRIQIDVCDGKYVSNVSWPLNEFSKDEFAEMHLKKDLDVFLPNWEKVDYSVDLMVENPDQYLETFVAYGVDEAIIHFRSIPFSREGDQKWTEIFEKCLNYQLDLVIALDQQVNLNEFINFIKLNESKMQMLVGLQVMGIAKIGLQGQVFLEDSLEIVKKLKDEFPVLRIYLDGGINDQTIAKIRDAGVEVFCVGSFLTKALNFTENLQVLKKILRDEDEIEI